MCLQGGRAGVLVAARAEFTKSAVSSLELCRSEGVWVVRWCSDIREKVKVLRIARQWRASVPPGAVSAEKRTIAVMKMRGLAQSGATSHVEVTRNCVHWNLISFFFSFVYYAYTPKNPRAETFSTHLL
jgi:hypothetical protein